MMLFEKTTILGVGLIGASLALSMKEISLTGHVAGHGRNEENLKKAKERGIIDSYDLDPAKACKDADLIIFAAPVGTFKSLAKAVRGSLKQGAVATDVGSVKGSLAYDMDDLMPEGVHYVACHPIAGSEQSGIDAARADLFKGKLCIITRTPSIEEEAFNKVWGLWSALGSRVELMDPEEHDHIFGLVSHLPHVAAYALMNAIADVDAGSLKYASEGFKGSTRIAASSPVLWRDICAFNSDNLIRALDMLKSNIEGITAYLREGDYESLEETFKQASRLRREIED
jgi:prephenate dehydrogenase